MHCVLANQSDEAPAHNGNVFGCLVHIVYLTYLCTYSRSNMEWGLNIHACTTCVMRIYLYGMVYHYYMYKYDRVYNKTGWIVLHDEN